MYLGSHVELASPARGNNVPFLMVVILVFLGLSCAIAVGKFLRPGTGWPYALGGVVVFAGGLGLGGLAFEPGTIVYAITGPLLALVGVTRATSQSFGFRKVLLLAGGAVVLAWLAEDIHLIASGRWYATFLFPSDG